MMGLLYLAGLNAGKKDRLSGPSAMNPKGFFELRSQNIFLEVAYPDTHRQVSSPPSLERIESVGEIHADTYRSFINHEFNDDFPVAVKSQNMLTIPFLDSLKSEIHPYIIALDRDVCEQASSIRRVWDMMEVRENMTEDDIKEFICKWNEFRDLVCRHYDLPTLRVQFEEMINKPYKTTKRVSNFIGAPCPPEDDVRAWIDPELANRKELDTIDTSPSFLQRACDRIGRLLLSYARSNGQPIP